MTEKKLSGKTALITGASRGLGKAMALGLANVALWILGLARKQEPANNAVNLALALAYEQTGELPKAIFLLQKVAPTHHDHAEIQRRIKDLMARDSIRRGFDDKTGAASASVTDTAEMNRAEPTATNLTAKSAV